MSNRKISEAECVKCQQYLVEKIDGLEKRVGLLFGGMVTTIVISALQLLLSLR
jgi:uracil-DNA glycosylase